MTDMKKIYTQHGDGIQDPKLVMDTDPLFKDVLGSSISRRTFLGMGAAGALGSMLPGPSFAAEKKFDPVVRKHVVYKESKIK